MVRREPVQRLGGPFASRKVSDELARKRGVGRPIAQLSNRAEMKVASLGPPR